VARSPARGPLALPRAPLRLGRAGHTLAPPPTLGQHNDEILGGELGLSRVELAELRAKKIIGERPAWL
jgi:crotonobetainyl-CoA:carnitine CoA-transferase CaiB-like acyl-CoA transferase